MRPNYAMDKPPTELTVGGTSYPIQTDFRVWIEAVGLMRKINPDPTTEAGARRTVEALEDLQELVFGGVLADENPGEVLKAIAEFMQGYPSAPMTPTDEDVPLWSYEYDLNEIIMAIRAQYGVDLSYRCKECHWWEFLLMFRTLAGNHYILNLMETRGYKGKDKEMLRRKSACALPVELTASEQEEWDDFAAQFK